LSIDGDRKWKPLLQERHIEASPQISPDGQWMAYVSNESEQQEVYVRPFPDVDKGKWQVSTGGGSGPLWSPNGRELFYLDSSNNSFMAADVETKPTFKAGKAKALFNFRDIGTSRARLLSGFDISPDGKRFLMTKQRQTTASEPAAARPHKINVVVNWFEELKQRVPVK